MGQPEPEHVTALFDGLERAAFEAVARTAPARLRSGLGQARIGRNRRTWDGPLDPDLLVIQVEDPDGRPRAVLFHYACHGTVLGHDNLAVSADWAGAAARRISEQTGAPALFLLGAHADIDPRTRALMDPAIPGQSVGLGFGAVRVLGEEVAEAVLGALDPIATSDAVVAATSRTLTLPLHLGEHGPEAAERRLAQRKAELARTLGVEPDALPRLSELVEFAGRGLGEHPLEEIRERIARARLYLRDKTAPFFTGGGRQVEVELQLLRVGDSAILALPFEPTTCVGLDWRKRTEGRAIGRVAGIANGWLRYLPHRDDLAHPRAHHHYEVLSSIVAAGACETLLSAGEELLAELF
jgi:hypothetical protein